MIETATLFRPLQAMCPTTHRSFRGTGLAVSSRGSQSRLDPSHPAGLAPGKRPRLTPSPALALRNGRLFMPFGTPGGDVQPQAMLQVLLNVLIFGMNPQQAVEAPRFCFLQLSQLFRATFLLSGAAENGIASASGDGRRARGAGSPGQLVAGLELAGRWGLHDHGRSGQGRSTGRSRPETPGIRRGLVVITGMTSARSLIQPAQVNRIGPGIAILPVPITRPAHSGRPSFPS